MQKDGIILASTSPRRRELLHLIFDEFEAVSPAADETARPGASPEEMVTEIACRKAAAAGLLPVCGGKIIIAADTLVCLDGEIYGKPTDTEDAKAQLRQLSGRAHTVYTGVCIIGGSGRSLSFCERSDVEFYPLSDEEIDTYIATGEPMDKAGSYGIQGKGALLVKAIHGDYYNVMGLPVARLSRALAMITD